MNVKNILSGSTTTNKNQEIDGKIITELSYYLKCNKYEKANYLSKQKFNLPKQFKIDNKKIKNGSKFTELKFSNSNYHIILKGKFICINNIIISLSEMKGEASYEKTEEEKVHEEIVKLFLTLGTV